MAKNKFKILIVGFGTVGKGFFDLFYEKRDLLKLGNVEISEIIDSAYGHILDPNPKDPLPLKTAASEQNLSVTELIKNSDADLVCEFTWVNYTTAEPALSHIMAALHSKKHVITTNKGPVALHFSSIMETAKIQDRLFKFKGTVMSGTPSFDLMDLIPGAKIKSVRGIMNGTTNFILSRIREGKDFDSALKEAQKLGYAENDPTNDIDGLDAAAKITIISKLLGWGHEFRDVERTGIRNVSTEEAKKGTKLIAYADEDKIYVKPTEVSDDILKDVNGTDNAIQFDTDTLGRITMIGPGAGKRETAQAAISDLVNILRTSR